MKKTIGLIALAALLIVEYSITRWALSEYDIAHGLDYFFSVAFIVLLLAILDAIILYFALFSRDKSGKRKKPALWMPLIALFLTGACMAGILMLNPVKTEKLKVKAFGEKLTYEYDEDMKTLTVSGTGGMKDTGNPDARPWDVENVETVVIEDGVTGIGYGAFQGCAALTSVQLPDSLLYLDMYAFAECAALERLDLNEGLLDIKGAAFERCVKLAHIIIPKSAQSVQGSAFGYCKSLEIAVADGHPYYAVIDGTLVDRRTMTLVCYPASKRAPAYTIPKDIKAIGYFAFDGCDALSNVVIPDGVSIDEDAFANGSLQIVCCNPGSEAERWAEKHRYIVLHTQTPVDAGAFAYMLGEYAGGGARDMEFRKWREMYASAQRGTENIEDKLALANDFAGILDAFASDTVFADGSEERGMPPLERCLDKIEIISGTVTGNIITAGDVDEYLNLCAIRPNGKVLPVYIKDSSRLVYIDPIAGLPEAFRPTTLDEVQYLLCFEFSVNYYGQYTSGAKAYTTDLELTLIELPSQTVVVRKTVPGAIPMQRIQSSGQGSIFKSPPSSEEQAEAVTMLLEGIINEYIRNIKDVGMLEDVALHDADPDFRKTALNIALSEFSNETLKVYALREDNLGGLEAVNKLLSRNYAQISGR